MRLDILVSKYKSELNDLEYDINELKDKTEVDDISIEVFVENLYYIKQVREAIDSLLVEKFKEEVETLDLRLFRMLEELELIQDKSAKELLKKAFVDIFQKFLPKPATL